MTRAQLEFALSLTLTRSRGLATVTRAVSDLLLIYFYVCLEILVGFSPWLLIDAVPLE